MSLKIPPKSPFFGLKNQKKEAKIDLIDEEPHNRLCINYLENRRQPPLRI
jgi:hypothetical protein